MWSSGLFHLAHDILVAQAEAQGGAATGTGAAAPAQAPNPYSMWIMLAGVIAIMYFFMIRPQQKREKERQQMLSSLSKGDRVVTNGGIFGTIIGLHEKTVVIRISDDPVVKVEVLRPAVSKVLGDSGKDKESEKGK
ncbi:MAG: hypothetical protein AMXMBFR84_33910 [Candidatus Hydrogenedentota bacterium]